MSKYKAVLFDLDGTILDTSEGIFMSVEEAAELLGLKKLPKDVIKTFIGPPIEWSFEDKYDIHGDDLKKAAATFRDRYSNHNLLHAKPYEGMFELFRKLRENGIGTAVATYKKQDYTMKLLKHFGVDEMVDVIYGSDYEGKLKKSDIIELCIRDLGVTKDEVLMVGDSKHDATGAEAIGVDFAGVSYGFGFEVQDDISEYKHVIYVDKAMDLFDFIVK